MKYSLKVAVGAVVLAIGSVLPAMAQITDGLTFTTSFPFYAGNVQMPAGSYKVTRLEMGSNELQIQSMNGKQTAFLDIFPTRSEQPHKTSDVTFHKYAEVDYLDRIWVAGQRYGMKVEPTNAEQKAASTTLVTEHTVSGY
jgi:hypothetical protein